MAGSKVNFEWDVRKAKINAAKHGVEFEVAKGVFSDQNAIIETDPNDAIEVRWRIIGLGTGNVLFVVFTEPDDETIRIISARRANRHEQDRYFRQALP